MSTPCRTLAANRGASFSKRIRLELHNKGQQAAERLGRLLFFSTESKVKRRRQVYSASRVSFARFQAVVLAALLVLMSPPAPAQQSSMEPTKPDVQAAGD